MTEPKIWWSNKQTNKVNLKKHFGKRDPVNISSSYHGSKVKCCHQISVWYLAYDYNPVHICEQIIRLELIHESNIILVLFTKDIECIIQIQIFIVEINKSEFMYCWYTRFVWDQELSFGSFYWFDKNMSQPTLKFVPTLFGPRGSRHGGFG